MEASMSNSIALFPGMFADVADDWRVFVIEADARHGGVVYVGSFPYDTTGLPLHPDAPAIVGCWDGKSPGARQISERQKRFDGLIPVVHFEPVFQQQYA
jgi:hypothetical protein